ncbi:MAG TPA: 1,3-beta-galactosyl-N-acetylhexosamine phosphorylase [Spirochaetia bacterium]|nr:1,3-beta-galactosyl-N-acetylhexosamine phosphorylase [Spirochaetia bacterium]
MQMQKGRFTLPAEKGMGKGLIELAERWGADAVRDSDGTALPEEVFDLGLTVYSTLCLIREDNEWAKAHRDCLQQAYLMSERITAFGHELEIPLMQGYFADQFSPDERHDPKLYWEVIDRTDSRILHPEEWRYEASRKSIVLQDAREGHIYTAGFLADQIWEPVSMYNHLTNSWNTEHRLPVDPRHPEARAHLLEVLEHWLSGHPRTDVVRFTTFFYNFDLLYCPGGKERRVDWFGYLFCVSAFALDEFASIYGYRLRPEDFIDQGYYNTPFRRPSERFRDWMEYNQRFVANFASDCVRLVHQAGKKAIMFLGDHWAGTEPYGPCFASIGLDGVVGAAGDGVTTRMITDIPVQETEVRFYPYFFPDIFKPGGDPVGESKKVWARSRRALLRRPAGRMGYGGYPSLALQFPDFVSHVETLAAQFRQIAEMARSRPAASLTVGVLTEWGSLRSWMTHQVAHSLWNERCYSYLGAMEALSGMDVETRFLSFDDICSRGVPKDVAVLINAGDAGTAWSGGNRWADPIIQERIRSWVARGGGFIGIGEPTAFEHEGAFFQLSDVLGVQKENGFTLNNTREIPEPASGHFVAVDMKEDIDLGLPQYSVFLCGLEARALLIRNRSVSVAVNSFGRGRAVYLSGLPYGPSQARLLRRALFWCSGKEKDFLPWTAEDPRVECHYYPSAGHLAVTNNADENVETTVFFSDGRVQQFSLSPLALVWMEV